MHVQLAERFPGHWPWELEEVPIDKLLEYLDLLGVEGYVRSERADLEPGDDMACFDCYGEG